MTEVPQGAAGGLICPGKLGLMLGASPSHPGEHTQRVPSPLHLAFDFGLSFCFVWALSKAEKRWMDQGSCRHLGRSSLTQWNFPSSPGAPQVGDHKPFQDAFLSPPPLLIRVQTKSKTSRGHSELLRASLLCKLRTEEGKSNPLISPNQSKIMRNRTDRLEFHDLEEALNHVLGLCLPKALVGIPRGVGG